MQASSAGSAHRLSRYGIHGFSNTGSLMLSQVQCTRTVMEVCALASQEMCYVSEYGMQQDASICLGKTQPN